MSRGFPADAYALLMGAAQGSTGLPVRIPLIPYDPVATAHVGRHRSQHTEEPIR
jgi:hypothetical protein